MRCILQSNTIPELYPQEISSEGFKGKVSWCLLLTLKWKSKLQWGNTSHQSEWPPPKKLQTINAGKDMAKREPSSTVGENVTWYSMEIPLKTKNKTTIWPSNPTTGHIPWENHNWERHMYPNVHCSIIYIDKTWEQPRCPSTDEWKKKFGTYIQWYITQP